MRRREFLASGSLALASAAFIPPAARLKAGQIGTAHGHADGKMETLRALDTLFEIAGVVEADPVRREQAMKRAAYKDLAFLEEAPLLALPDLALVAVETAVEDLVPTARRCVAAGRHVHLDKPAGPSLPLFRSLLEEAKAKGVLIQLGYMFRYNPGFKFCLQAVKEGWIGDVIEVNGVIGKKSSPEQRPSHSPEPGGTMYELGGHLIDALVALAGPPDKVTPHIRRLGKDGRADNQLAVFEYPKMVATIRSEIVDPFGGPRRQFSVVGTEGFVEIRPLEPAQVVLGLEKPRGGYKAGQQTVKFPGGGGRYEGEFRDFAAAIGGTAKLPYGAAHDLAVHESLLRASGMSLE